MWCNADNIISYTFSQLVVVESNCINLTLIDIVAEGEDPIGKITACIFATRLSPPVRDQVLLQCGAAGVASATVNVNRDKPSLEDIRAIHNRCHFAVDRTLALARERFNDGPFTDGVSRKTVKWVMSRCDRCACVDPSIPFRWLKTIA